MGSVMQMCSNALSRIIVEMAASRFGLQLKAIPPITRTRTRRAPPGR